MKISLFLHRSSNLFLRNEPANEKKIVQYLFKNWLNLQQ
jgi:hypothetical protein